MSGLVKTLESSQKTVITVFFVGLAGFILSLIIFSQNGSYAAPFQFYITSYEVSGSPQINFLGLTVNLAIWTVFGYLITKLGAYIGRLRGDQ